MKAMTKEGGNPYLTSKSQLARQAEAQRVLAAMTTFDEHASMGTLCVDGGGRTERWSEMCLPCDEPCYWHWRYKYSDRNKGFDSRVSEDVAPLNEWLARRRKEWSKAHESGEGD